MRIIKIPPSGIFMVNGYLVVSDNNNAVLIDAPCRYEEILRTADKNSVTISKILITHGHCDHIESLSGIAEAFDSTVYIHTNDAAKLTDSRANLAGYFRNYFADGFDGSCKNTVTVNDGDVIMQDELSFRVMHTPGHSEGSVCYMIDDIIFSGDTLFNMSVGRTDFPGGDASVLSNSLCRLLEFKGGYGDYRIMPGHGDETALSFERENNPYLIPFKDII